MAAPGRATTVALGPETAAAVPVRQARVAEATPPHTASAGASPLPQFSTRWIPEYSEEARKAKYSGSVMLSIVVNTDGRADDIKVVRSLGMGLDEKAIEAVGRWRFRPGTKDGVPVRVRAQVEVNFRLL